MSSDAARHGPRAALVALKRAAGDLELEILHAAQTGERGVLRGAGPTPAELAEARRIMDRAREDFARLRETWLSRARSAAPPCPELPCLHCARARGRGEPVPCAGCLAGAEGAATP